MLKKIKRLWQHKFVQNYLLLIISFLFLEIIFHLNASLNLFAISSIRLFCALNILAVFFSFFISFLPKKVNAITISVLVFIVTIYGILELGFKNYLGVYASFLASSQTEAVTSYILDFIKSFKWQFYLLFIPFILLLIYYIFIAKKISLDMPKRKVDIYLMIIKYFEVLLLIFWSLGFYTTLKFSIFQNKMQPVTSLEIFKKPTNPSFVVSEFGYISFGILDIKEYFFPGKDIEMEIDYNPETINSKNSKAESHITIDNAIWKDIIDQEKNITKNTLNKYFISKEPSTTNEYTGIFEGKNAIIIMIESGSNLLLNAEYYPNISKLAQDGWNFSNYYSPRNTCSTINNEFSNLTGLYTINNNCTASYYKDNTYFESIFNLFNQKGYNATSYHDHIDAYYPRSLIHKNLGSNHYYPVNALKIPYSTDYGTWASDEDFINAYLKILDEKETNRPFMSFLTTITSHMPYLDTSIYNDLYKKDFPSNYPTDVRAYMSKLKVVDNGVGILIKGLEERNILKDTVIVLVADHYPYGISKTNLSKAYGYDISKDNEAEKVPFIIYNSEIKPKTFEQYTSHVNTTPTIANLFNLDFDSRIYLGTDVLAKNYQSLVIFDDASWKNEYAFYNSSSNNITYYTEKVYSEEEILAINELVSLKLKMSSLAIKSNYFNYLNNELNSYLSIS